MWQSNASIRILQIKICYFYIAYYFSEETDGSTVPCLIIDPHPFKLDLSYIPQNTSINQKMSAPEAGSRKPILA